MTIDASDFSFSHEPPISSITPEDSGVVEVRPQEEIEQGSRLRDRLGEKWRYPFIAARLMADAIVDDYHDHQQNEDYTRRQKFAAKVVGPFALTGSVYSGLRGPEIFGTALATRTFKETYERTSNFASAIAAASVAVGSSVYLQQKLIGKTWVEVSEYYQRFYDSFNGLYPRSSEVLDDVMATSKEHPVAEGYAMFGYGTAPFIFANKAANPNISKEELVGIEKRVTRRGSLFAVGFAGGVFSIVSYAHYLPAKAGEWANRGAKWFVDNVSNPFIAAAIFTGLPLLGKGVSKIKSVFTKAKPEAQAELA